VPAGILDASKSFGMGETAMSVFRHERKAKRAMLMGSNSVLEYSGTNQGGTAASHSGKTKFGVAVLVPGGSQELHVWETDLVFSMQQRPTAATAAAVASHVVDSTADMDEATRRALVVDTFGSKKAQQIKKKLQENREAAATIAGASTVLRATEALAADPERGRAPKVGALTAAEEAEESLRRAVLPKFNRSATTPDGAYPFEGVLDEESLNSLGKAVNILLKALRKAHSKAVDPDAVMAILNKSLESDVMPVKALGNFARQQFLRLANLAEAGEASVSRRPLEALLVLSLLLAMHKEGKTLKPPKVAAAEGVIAPTVPACLASAPAEVSNALLRKFTERQGGGGGRVSWVRSSQLQDKLKMHIAVCALWVSGFDLPSILALARDLSMPPRELAMSYFRQVGCRFSSAVAAAAPSATASSSKDAEALASASASGDSDFHVSLVAPLIFPPPRRKRGRGN
jgi:hypothetical protein